MVEIIGSMAGSRVEFYKIHIGKKLEAVRRLQYALSRIDKRLSAPIVRDRDVSNPYCRSMIHAGWLMHLNQKRSVGEIRKHAKENWNNVSH
ncbi:unnamed protein product [Ambrosiozyma monospora]|uniref:Unnamed protein product n=1 Tax=Ambrosiozyma monospora TaxID=43982 RepID=A0ACB5TNM3_AMBMO|nr:unnamed protein product [Ambrosiozyma monospora]